MAEIGAGAHTTDNKDNPYLELKDDKGYPNVSAQSIHASEAKEELK